MIHQKDSKICFRIKVSLLIVCFLCDYKCRGSFVCPVGSKFHPSVNFCIGLSVRSNPIDAVKSCPAGISSDSIETLWDGPEEIWTTLRRAYRDGPFVKWAGGNSMGEPVVLNWNTSVNFTLFKDKFCVGYNPLSLRYIPRSCEDDKLPALCVFPPLQPDPNSQCDRIPVAMQQYPLLQANRDYCLQIVRSSVPVNWEKAADICESLSHGRGKLVQRGYYHLLSFPKLRLVPLGVKVEEDYRVLWATGTNEGSQVSPAEINFFSARPHSRNSSLIAALNVSTGEWLVVNETNFDTVACEIPLQRPVDTSGLTMEAENSFLKATVPFYLKGRDALRCFSDSQSVVPRPLRVVENFSRKSNAYEFFIPLIGDGYYYCYLYNDFSVFPKSSGQILVDSFHEKTADRIFVKTIEGSDVSNEFWNVSSKPISVLLKPRTRFHDYEDFLHKGTNIAAIEVKNTVEVSICPFLVDLEDQLYFHNSSCRLKRIYNEGTLLFHIRKISGATPQSLTSTSQYDVIHVRGTTECFPSSLRLVKGSPGSTVKVRNECQDLNVTCVGDYNEGYRWSIISRADACPDRHMADVASKPEDSVVTSDDILSVLQQPTSNSTTFRVASRMISTFMENGSKVPMDVFHGLEKYSWSINMENRKELQAAEKHFVVLLTKVDESVLESDGDLTYDFVQSEDESVLGGFRAATKREDFVLKVNIPKNALSKDTKLLLATYKLPVLENAGERVNSQILSVSTSTRTAGPFSRNLQLFFRAKDSRLKVNEERVCVFWSDLANNWDSTGCTLVLANVTAHDLCECNHMTHFAELIRPKVVEDSPEDSRLLELISLVSCVASLSGLLVIFLTAVVFPSWRMEPGHYLSLHFSLSIGIMQMVFLLVMSTSTLLSETFCVISGVFLHYSILVSFMWMLVSAYLQFLRLVIVFADKQVQFIVQKGAFLVYGVSSVPIIVLLSIDVGFYRPQERHVTSNNSFCYPSGLSFYLTILAPVGLIVSCNVVIYLMILWSFWSSRRRSPAGKQLKNSRGSAEINARMVLVSVFLFFLFGLTWIFGFLSNVQLFGYLFCVVGPLQGFVLFVFFILLDAKTRGLWLTKLHCMKKQEVIITTSSSISKSRSSNFRSTSRIR